MTGRTTPIKVGTTGAATLAHPMAETGEQPSGAIVWHVLDCPPEVTAGEVLELFAATMVWRPGCYRVRFAELGRGRLVQ